MLLQANVDHLDHLESEALWVCQVFPAHKVHQVDKVGFNLSAFETGYQVDEVSILSSVKDEI